MRIGELSRRTGVSVRSLRYYEDQGMLASRRTPGGHREYGDDAVGAVERIQSLFAAGLCSEKIVELLPCMRDRDRGAPTPDLLDRLAVERTRIDGMIARLEHSRDLLDGVIAETAAASAPAGRAAAPAAPPRAATLAATGTRRQGEAQ
jgi:DNA-binding transcriptional MerR regulator